MRVKDRISIFLPGDHREVPLNDIKKVGSSKTAPYSAFFSEAIAPAMMNTGASPEQICSVIRKTESPSLTPAV